MFYKFGHQNIHIQEPDIKGPILKWTWSLYWRACWGKNEKWLIRFCLVVTWAPFWGDHTQGKQSSDIRPHESQKHSNSEMITKSMIGLQCEQSVDTRPHESQKHSNSIMITSLITSPTLRQAISWHPTSRVLKTLTLWSKPAKASNTLWIHDDTSATA